MSRNPNVEALRVLTAEWGARLDRGEPTEGLAEFLASRNVLAVDSLSDEQAAALPNADFQPLPRIGERVRAALRRCATGEVE